MIQIFYLDFAEGNYCTRYSLLVTLSVVALLDKQQEIFIFKNSLHSESSILSSTKQQQKLQQSNKTFQILINFNKVTSQHLLSKLYPHLSLISKQKESPSIQHASLEVEVLARFTQLARIFHGDSSRGAAQRDADKTDEDLSAGLYWTYRPSSNRSPTQSASGSRKPQQNQREICGLVSN